MTTTKGNTMTQPGRVLDTFTLATEHGEIQAEIRLAHAADGTEMLWHYENGRLVLAHPARRCSACAEVITASSIGTRCYACAADSGLNV